MDKKKKKQIRNSTVEFLIFTNQDGKNSIEVRIENETIWLTQKLISTLFDVTIPTVNEHLKNIFATYELQEKSVIRKFRTTAADGKNYNTNFYNLDAIISVGYRVNSKRATQFRQWATNVLKNYAIKRLNLLSKEKLKTIDKFIDSIEHNNKKKNIILSFAGSWKNLDNELFEDLTSNLHDKRKN